MGGAVVAPDAAETAHALRLGAQTTAALFAFLVPGDGPPPVPPGDGPPVVFRRPPEPGTAAGDRLTQGLKLATITRQHDLVSFLGAVPTARIPRAPAASGVRTHQWVDLHRALVTGGPVAQHPAFLALREAYTAESEGRSAADKVNRLLMLPYFEVLRRLDEGDPVAFNQALADAVRQHKRYWSSTERLRNDPQGWVSINLTAAAALAHSRGLPVEVDSDYVPRSWITGELFRPR
jgi:hypothetical protein